MRFRFAVWLSFLAPFLTCACSSGHSTAPTGSAPTGSTGPTCSDAPTVVYSSSSDPNAPAVPNGGVAIGNAFYFLDPGEDPEVENVVSIVPGGQSTVVAVTPTAVSPLMTDGTNLVWVTEQSIETLTPGSTPAAPLPTTIFGTTFACDASNVYALAADDGIPPTLLAQPRAGGDVQTLATIPGVSDQARMYDGGDALVVIDIAGGMSEDGGTSVAGVYLVTKSTGAVSYFAAPPSVYKIWPAPSTSALYANSPAGLLESYALGGGVVPLWPDGGPSIVTDDLAVEPDGTVVFGGLLQENNVNVGYALGSVPAGRQAEVGACINASTSLYLLGVVTLGDSGYAILSFPQGPRAPWEIVKIPQ